MSSVRRRTRPMRSRPSLDRSCREPGGAAAITRLKDDRLGPAVRRQRARCEGRRVGERPGRGSQGRGERRRHRAERRDRDQRSRRSGCRPGSRRVYGRSSDDARNRRRNGPTARYRRHQGRRLPAQPRGAGAIERARARRHRLRDRIPPRPRCDGNARYRLRSRPKRVGSGRIDCRAPRRPAADRRGDQPGELGRSARRRVRAGRRHRHGRRVRGVGRQCRLLDRDRRRPSRDQADPDTTDGAAGVARSRGPFGEHRRERGRARTRPVDSRRRHRRRAAIEPGRRRRHPGW